MEEIVQTRGLTIGTIVTHLEYYVRLGEVKLEQVVEIEKVMKIHQYLQGKENPGIVELKAALGMRFLILTLDLFLLVMPGDILKYCRRRIRIQEHSCQLEYREEWRQESCLFLSIC